MAEPTKKKQTVKMVPNPLPWFLSVLSVGAALRGLHLTPNPALQVSLKWIGCARPVAGGPKETPASGRLMRVPGRGFGCRRGNVPPVLLARLRIVADDDSPVRQLRGAELAEGSIAAEILTREGDREVGHVLDGQESVSARIRYPRTAG